MNTPYRFRSASLSVAVASLLTAAVLSPNVLQANDNSYPGGGHGYGHSGSQRQHNMRLVGFDSLQGRPAYQPIVHKQAAGYILYAGHHNGQAPNPLEAGALEPNGTSIVDVTDPRFPVYLAHIPADGGAVSASGDGQAQMVRACDGDELPGGEPGRTYLLRANGGYSHQIWDTTDPRAPFMVSEPVSGLEDTHKSEWECSTGIAYLASGVSDTTNVPSDPGGYETWREDRTTQVFDLSNPLEPKFIRNFGLDGQQPYAEGTVPEGLHGCLSVQDHFPWRAAGGLQAAEGTEGRVYCGYGTNGNGVIQILNRETLLDVSDLSDDERKNGTTDPDRVDAIFNAPVVSQLNTPVFMGAHTTFPVLDMNIAEFANDGDSTIRTRDILVVVNEAIGEECGDRSRQLTYFADITEPVDEEGNAEAVHIWPMSNFNVPESDGDFCTRGRRFGSHGSNESFTDVFYKRLVFVSWFNAGVRAIDIRDPFNPREAAFYIPRTNEYTDNEYLLDRPDNGETNIHTNNVEVDDRGYIYTADRAGSGMHALKLTGRARRIANLP